MSWNIIIQTAVLALIVSGALILLVYIFIMRTTDGALQRLDRDAEAARKREAELNQKIKEADEQLQARQKELDIIEKKMRQEFEDEVRKQKDELIQKARQEAEDIITKAQNAKDGIRKEIEKNMEIKIVDYTVKIMGDVFSSTYREELDRQLCEEFILKLDKVDLSRLGPDIHSVDIISANPLDQKNLNTISSVFKQKLGRELKLIPKTDKNVLGGVMLQFDTLMLDGSLQNSFKDAANSLKQIIEKQYTV